MFIIDLVRILSVLISLIGTAMVIPIFTAIYCHELNIISSFLIPMVCSWILCIFVNIPFNIKKQKINLNIRKTFVVVACCWIFASLFGMIPFYISGVIPNFTNAFFESVSGFSTTGCTILHDISNVPRSINMWRCLTHWLGGMGIVGLTVAILPLLGSGGFQLIKAELTGPEKEKVAAKITTTAKILWIFYVSFTVIQAVLLKIFGMDFVDSFAHAFSTLGTGGFSTVQNSIGEYNSFAIEIICTIFMVISGINFSLFYFAFRKKWNEIFKNSELKIYLAIIILISIMLSICLTKVYGSFWRAARYSVFQTVSVITTTGFFTADFCVWPETAKFFIFVLFFIGGCSGSTAGGVKVVRWIILLKQAGNEIRKIIHPRGVFSLRLNDEIARKELVFSSSTFFILYLFLVLITTFVGCLGSLDIFTAFSAGVSMVGNIGPAFGSLCPSANFDFLPIFVKWWYCFAMLAGRLELYTMIIFFMPAYWKN